ncbi:MAG TPA: DJ-1 family protein [Ruminococcaceae bacterium]|jgi:4-methyl-5(b-hydroxyethyl)-thiazole monophosphate biosynthesis|nr:DJ-1 family protein [Oscillospiraceae bacterium]HCM23259.1 DJ-1 family protein [Oscillospiraceae bacterium]
MIYEFLANGFEEVEAMAPLDILRRTGLQLTTVGIGERKVIGARGVEIKADLADSDLDFSEKSIDMVILPGGMPGTKNLEASAVVQKAVEHCIKSGSFVAAICAAPSILGHWGVLKGHEATCYPGYESELGCKVSSLPVVQSDKIITAKGAGVAVDFGLKLAEVLCGAEKSKEIRKSIQCM